MKRLLTLGLFFLVFPVLSGVVIAQEDTITEIIESRAEADDDEEFTILLDLLDEVELAETLDDEDFEFTVFAPTDEAFEALFDEMDIEQNDLEDDEDLLTDVLLYHVLDGAFESGDLEDGQEVETLHGGTMLITVDEETIIINNIAEVLDADIEAGNGFIHIIDTVLLPSIGSGEACQVSTDASDFASVHVGPGNNRTSVTFLEPGIDYEVLGQNEDSGGTIWYQLVKEEAAPGRAINEAWVSSEEVETSGDCETIGEASAPPVIPITNRPPPDIPDDDSSDDSVPPATGALPSAGSWTVFWNANTNASCTGTGNVTIPTVEIVGGSTSSTSVGSVSSSGFTFDGVRLNSIGNGVFSGASTLADLTGTIYIDSIINSGEMLGRYIVSFPGCSATLNFVARH